MAELSQVTPVLMNGIGGKQDIYTAVTDQRHPLGTAGRLLDGRAYRYACNRGAAIDAGTLVQGAQISVDFDDLATNTAALGATTVNVTPVGTATYAENQLQGGYLSINTPAVANAGRTYRIGGNPATTAATAFDLTLSEPIRDEAFAAGTTATVVPNPWSATVIAAAGAAHFVAGAVNFDVGAGSTTPQYFWCQTGGHTTLPADVVGDVIGHSIVSGTTLTGSFIGFVDAAGDVPQIIGVNLIGNTVDGDYSPVFLNIAW